VTGGYVKRASRFHADGSTEGANQSKPNSDTFCGIAPHFYVSIPQKVWLYRQKVEFLFFSKNFYSANGDGSD